MKHIVVQPNIEHLLGVQLTDIALASGRVVTHRPIGNGAHDAIMTDGKGMSRKEWQEYCDIRGIRS